MKYSSILLVILLLPALFGGEISGTITNATTVDGLVLIVGALHAGITDLTSMPAHFSFMPSFPHDYTITNDAITNMNIYFPVAFMPRGILPASGDPFAARIFPPVIPTGGVATGVDLTLFSSGCIGGNISYSGPYDDVYINVYDYYSLPEPSLESTHYIGRRSYLVEVIPSGPKRVQAFADINGNGRFDEGEPNGFYEMPFVGIDIVLVTGNISSSGINITIQSTDIQEEVERPAETAISAYPNPFNSAVTISVDGYSRENGNPPVQIEIFDLAGRRVAEIPVGEGLPAFPLDGNSENGSAQGHSPTTSEFIWTPPASLPSGVYLVCATIAGDKGLKPNVQTKRVVYLK